MLPRLNMAIPKPASDNIAIDPFTIVGIWIFHLFILPALVTLINFLQYDLRIF